MIEKLARLVNDDPSIVRWGRRMNETFMVEVGDKGARFVSMKNLGHFPMSENPEAFLGYLRPVLDEIRRTARS